MSGTDSLRRAREGDPDSIAALLDRQLRPQGVTVTGLQTTQGLQLSLKGVTVEQQLLLRPYLGAALRQIQVPMDRVQVQGCTAKGKTIWQEELVLTESVTAADTAQEASIPDLSPKPSPLMPRSQQTRLVAMALAAIAGAAFAIWHSSQPSPQSPSMVELPAHRTAP